VHRDDDQNQAGDGDQDNDQVSVAKVARSEVGLCCLSSGRQLRQFSIADTLAERRHRSSPWAEGPRDMARLRFVMDQIREIEDPAERAEFVRRKRDEYAADIDILHLASEMVVDSVIEPDDLRAELIRRFALAESKDRRFSAKRNPVTPA